VRLSQQAVLLIIRQALREDRASADLTSRALIPSSLRVRARLIAKAPGILSGGPVAVWAFHAVDPSLRCVLRRRDGQAIRRGQTILTIEGRARSIFAAERTALNLLGHLSGVATLTQAFVRQVRPSRAKIYDTRKTLPGLRTIEKYAVRIGGGHNHRASLAEAILIKTNHLRTATHDSRLTTHDLKTLVLKAKHRYPMKRVEIEVTNLTEYKAALSAGAESILLDNWSLPNIRKAMALRRHGSWVMGHGSLLEVSGGVTLANVRAIARTGVDRISIGRLTHSAPSLDVSLEVV